MMGTPVEELTAEQIASLWTHGSNVAQLEIMILRHMEHHVLQAVTAEREACAKIAEGFMGEPMSAFFLSTAITKAIRARGSKA